MSIRELIFKPVLYPKGLSCKEINIRNITLAITFIAINALSLGSSLMNLPSLLLGNITIFFLFIQTNVAKVKDVSENIIQAI